MRKLLLLTILAAIPVLAFEPVAVAQADRNCGSFASQAAAQSYFTAKGGNAANNSDNLDANHNGTACDNYNYGNVSNIAQQQFAATAQPATTGSTTPNAPRLTKSGGPELLIPAVALLLGSGLVALGLMRRNS